ncbi:MAG: ferredoxin--NADP reductase [candidate division Zixibacteria bacterium]|nr:ferredoxin--NADP reductase [candidate division Zixibacteria bacterium]
MAAKELNAIVSQRIEVTPSLIKLRVIPDGWELPDFEPGQFGVLGLPGSASRYSSAAPEENPPDSEKLILRAYSVASSSVAKEYIEFYIGLVRSGSLTPRLLNLKRGDKLWVGPKFKGMFTLSEVPNEFNLVLIATGTGVAPYISMIRSELAKGARHRFAVIHGACFSGDLGYHDELTTLASANKNFTYMPILSHAQDEVVPWKGHEGFVDKLWTDGTLENSWGLHPTPENTHVFLCGNPLMIKSMVEVLEKENFIKHSKKSPGQVHTEQFFVKL